MTFTINVNSELWAEPCLHEKLAHGMELIFESVSGFDSIAHNTVALVADDDITRRALILHKLEPTKKHGDYTVAPIQQSDTITMKDAKPLGILVGMKITKHGDNLDDCDNVVNVLDSVPSCELVHTLMSRHKHFRNNIHVLLEKQDILNTYLQEALLSSKKDSRINSSLDGYLHDSLNYHAHIRVVDSLLRIIVTP